MATPNFFSIERKGYTKVSDLFYDVMQDMLENGFNFINCSNATKDTPLTYWVPSVVSSTPGKKVGDKLYILHGTRQMFAGSERPAPYVQVTSISNTTTSTVGNTVVTTGAVTGLTEVISSYDFPIWTSTILPSEQITLSTSQTTQVDSGVEVTLANIMAQSDRSSSFANVQYAPSTFSFTLEAGGLVDSLNSDIDPNSLTREPLQLSARQPWRIQFVIPEEQKASAAVATHLQMYYDEPAGKVKISQVTDDFGQIIDNVGVTGAHQPGGVFVDTDLNQGIYNRKVRVANQPQTYPLSYVLSITNRGFFLGIYEGSWSTTRGAATSRSNYFNWILVQRPVDRGIGKILTAGKAPVFHINSVNYKYYKAVVRESDILHPTSGPLPVPLIGNVSVLQDAVTSVDPTKWRITGDQYTKFLLDLEIGCTLYESSGKKIGVIKEIVNNATIVLTTPATSVLTLVPYSFTPPSILALRVPADTHSPDSHAIFNSVEQVSLTEDKTYLLSFPHNLTTPRFRYTEELDMIGTTSSDVVMSGQDIQFKTYGELGPRTYRALPANGPLNTGLRIAVLWAPQGPKWESPNADASPVDLGQITEGSQPNTLLQAAPVPVLPGENVKQPPTFRIERGGLPAGLNISQEGDQWRISGVVERADYVENTVIKFTVAAVNREDTGYSLKDMFFTYIV
jgi:hypothetical protein